MLKGCRKSKRECKQTLRFPGALRVAAAEVEAETVAETVVEAEETGSEDMVVSVREYNYSP